MRRFALFVGLVFVLAMLTINIPFITPKAHADEQVDVYDQQKQLVKSVVFVVGNNQYFVNGQTPGISMDARPFVETGRTFVPIRYLGNALGVTDDYIGWDSPKVTLDEPGFPVVELAVGSKTIRSDSQAKTMDVAPLLRQGRTYLPARFVAEALGYEVAWDSVNSIVLCWPKGAEKPDVSAVVEHITGRTPVTPPETQHPPVNPTGSMQELFSKAKPVEGKPFSFTGWNFDPGKQTWLQEMWDLSNDINPEIQEVTVNDLRPNGIKMGGDTGQIIHDLKVTKDGVTITATRSDRVLPHFYLVEENNLVRYEGGGGYMGQETGTLTQDVKYIGRRPIDPLPTPDLTKVTHILFEYGGEFLSVKNPIYQGGK